MHEADLEIVERLVVELAELPREARGAAIARRCAPYPHLQAEVESLLAALDRAGAGFLQSISPAPVSALLGPPAHAPGEVVGGFRLIEPIGEGGMGVVYRAERVGEFGQQVALKLIAAPLGSARLRHMLMERQILAALHHPHIVTLLDGGVTPAGQGYLVMEYVDGVPLTQYCRERRLALDERIRLVRQVCGAVHYAHQRGVVHRDLKPGNILVTPDGVPKVLDFGVAKLLAPDAEPGDLTVPGMLRPLTPNYASPEQLRGLPVTTASDIYALGVLLYETLTGVRPYDTSSRTLDDVLRIVLEEEPARPSRALPPADDALPYDRRAIGGDLDAIVLMAMSKEPSRRYASAQDLADDLARYQARRPVVAREPSLGYLVASIARRHRAAVAATAISIAALLLALGISVWQTRVAVAERNRAAARFNEAREMANTLIFQIHDAVRPLAGSTQVRELIVSRALTYLERLSREAEDDGSLRLELARAYHRIGTIQGAQGDANLGDYDGAVASLRRAIALLEPAEGTPDLDSRLELGRLRISLARAASAAGDSAGAADARRIAVERAEALVREAPNPESRRLLGSAYFMQALVAPHDQALAIWLRAADAFDALLAEEPDNPDAQRNVALVNKYIGGNHEAAGRLEEALRHYRRALDLDRARAAALPSAQAQMDLAISLGNVASAAWQQGDLDAAADGYRRSLEIRRRLADADAANVYARARVAFVLSRLGRIHADRREFEVALAHGREAVALTASHAGLGTAERRHHVEALFQLARTELEAAGAPTACRTVHRIRENLRGSEQPDRLLIEDEREWLREHLPGCPL